jgi:hypothetical protein
MGLNKLRRLNLYILLRKSNDARYGVLITANTVFSWLREKVASLTAALPTLATATVAV